MLYMNVYADNDPCVPNTLTGRVAKPPRAIPSVSKSKGRCSIYTIESSVFSLLRYIILELYVIVYYAQELSKCNVSYKIVSINQSCRYRGPYRSMI